MVGFGLSRLENRYSSLSRSIKWYNKIVQKIRLNENVPNLFQLYYFGSLRFHPQDKIVSYDSSLWLMRLLLKSATLAHYLVRNVVIHPEDPFD